MFRYLYPATNSSGLIWSSPVRSGPGPDTENNYEIYNKELLAIVRYFKQ